MKFVGHDAVRKRLVRLLHQDVMPQAHLFVGPAHIGKTTLATLFATAVARGARTIDMHTAHMDVFVVPRTYITSASGTRRRQKITVATVRHIVREMSRSPLDGVRRVVIVPYADEMTIAAQNALLKTLEEPPSQSLIILTTAHEGLLLPTVRSRTVRHVMTTVAATDLAPLDVGDVDAQIVMGRPGIAVLCAQDPAQHEWYQSVMADADRIAQMNVAERVQCAARLAQDVARLEQVVELWIAVWHGQLLTISQRRVTTARMIARATHALTQLRQTQAQPRLVLESFLLEL
jgi:replication-associated recombination protein RarA